MFGGSTGEARQRDSIELHRVVPAAVKLTGLAVAFEQILSATMQPALLTLAAGLICMSQAFQDMTTGEDK